MLDKDLADFYQVKPIRLREQVKRNPNRFPSDFVFQLIDDESVFFLLNKRMEMWTATIYTSKINKELQLDLLKYNSQYNPIKVKILKNTHDRFLILDNHELYHIGASIKDLGKKWFAASKMNSLLPEILKMKKI